MVYLPTFGCFLGQMLVNIPYMEHMGMVADGLIDLKLPECRHFLTPAPIDVPGSKRYYKVPQNAENKAPGGDEAV